MADDNNNEWNPGFFNQFRTMLGSDEPTNYGAGPSATPGYPPYPGLTSGYPPYPGVTPGYTPYPGYPPYPSYPPYPGPTPGLGGFTGPAQGFTGLQNYGEDATVQNQGGDATIQNQGGSTPTPKKGGQVPNREEVMEMRRKMRRKEVLIRTNGWTSIEMTYLKIQIKAVNLLVILDSWPEITSPF